ncbi:MAG: ribonuclease H-like domain-containing protein [Actinomycetota bacterium]|nr:ribonuclease H-like domain-containing protein [Actinomycetota bacterium]
MARIVNGSIRVKQYLARSYEEEAAVLYLLNHNLSKNTVLVSFNGRMFDVPFIRQRLYYYSLAHDLDKMHLDILQFCRFFWKDQFDSFRLSSLEENLLGIQRHQDLPGYMVPQFYQQYLDNGNVDTLVPVINHNRQDLVLLAKLFSLLHKQWKKFQTS